MNKRKKHTLPSWAEKEKQRFHRLVRQKPAPYPDRPQGRKSRRKNLIRKP